MAQVQLDIEGLSRWLQNAYEQLPRAANNRIQRKAVAAATRFYQNRVQAGTPVFNTGEVRKAVGSIVRRYQRRGVRGVLSHTHRGAYFLGIVGFRFHDGANRRLGYAQRATAPHAHLIEFGTVKRATKGLPGRGRFRGIVDVFRTLRINRRPGVYNRGVMPAQPFFRSLVRGGIDGGFKVIADTLREEVGREFERIGRGRQAQGGDAPHGDTFHFDGRTPR